MSWRFCIDVGGTFTDCIAVCPEGRTLRAKVLSSGVVKGAISHLGSERSVCDASRRTDADAMWNGYRFHLLDDRGDVVAETTVVSFHGKDGQFELASALPECRRPGQAYELASGEEAPILAIRQILGLPLAKALPQIDVRLGTTRGTNALITRHGARCAFVTTRGFGDILEIGYQNRPHLFQLAIEKRASLYQAVLEIDERVAADGEILERLDAATAHQQLQRLKGEGIESLAICLLNAYASAVHEQQLEATAREIGFEEVSVSHRVAPVIKIVSRGDTTVCDAYLNPVLRRYVDNLRESLGDSHGRNGGSAAAPLRVLTSAGSLVTADRFVGKDSILSGPAGGVVGFSKTANSAGFDRAIGFDMGGTSTDVARFDGQYDLEYETEKAGVRVVAPMMAIETVAAGGGSICDFDGVKLTVGPDSAGASPGPACYGRGGPLAVTDCNFYLGKVLADHFPFPLDRAAVETRLEQLCATVGAQAGRQYAPRELAEGFLRIANANMAAAIRSISIAKGYDPRDYVLVAFGGAAPQHACAVADELGMDTVLIHPNAGILSAVGIGLADVTAHRVEGVYQPLDDADLPQEVFERLSRTAVDEVADQGIAREQIALSRSLDLRYQGLESFLNIEEPRVDDASDHFIGEATGGAYAKAYHNEHRRLYGYAEDRPIELVAVRVQATGRSADALPESNRAEMRMRIADATRSVWFAGSEHSADLFERAALQPGDCIAGPALLVEDLSTTIIDPGWTAAVRTDGQLFLTRQTELSSTPEGEARSRADDDAPDPILLEIFNNHFAAIAEQMGISLRNTSTSVNVKERLDFSCAVFTAEGALVANAPHIPVHLGAMGVTVRRVLADNPQMQPGDVFVTNDPYRGGSHLPDVTVVTPVFDDVGGRLFITASRAHHAEIGGIVPGSMPPHSKNLAEEGVLIRNFRLVAAGRSRMADLRELLTTAEYPSRSADENLADISAQIAANQQGARDLQQLVDKYSLATVQAYMEHIRHAAETKMRAALARLDDGSYQWTDYLETLTEGDLPITVSINISGEEAVIDFTGTAGVSKSNLNANEAIVTAAVLYVLRCLIDEDIPLNEGVLAPVTLVLPECLLNPPERGSPGECAAVVGGNVETSQRVVDVLLGALDVASASQGTMNNLIVGDETFGYYETICGGAGATPSSPGADAVHTHMTNTRMTDPEVIEQRYPMRLREFSIRRGSGGEGQHRGGDGVVRTVEFLKRLNVSILSQRRGDRGPFGLDGGRPGRPGRNLLCRTPNAQGVETEVAAIEKLAGAASTQVHPGDQLTIKTPGGGGYGNPG